MTRSPLDRINDIRAAIAAIRTFEQSGRATPIVFDAVRMRLLEIGEAANGIPSEIQQLEPSIPWGDVIGMRNWMAHRYFDTVEDYVWATVDQDLDPLLEALDRIETKLRSPMSENDPS